MIKSLSEKSSGPKGDPGARKMKQSNNSGWVRAVFSLNVGTKTRCYQAGWFIFSGNYK
jgi:hypothetical protein